MANIDPLSGRSLFVELLAEGTSIGSATGFVVQSTAGPLLVTNWHVLSGLNPDTRQPLSQSGAVPDCLRLVHHSTTLGTWVTREETLLGQDGEPRWLEHTRGEAVDVAALPLQEIDSEVQLRPLDLSLADTDMVPEIAMPVSIIGFPLGLTGPGVFPIWKTGHIASEPQLDYAGQPTFLIDATTRGGMSGSPVVIKMSGGYKTRSGKYTLAGGVKTLFLGIYSGRIRRDSEIGKVWRPEAIRDVLARA